MTFAVKSKDDFCILLSVAAFILCGFRHCVADMYYVLLGATSWINWVGLISVTLGNILGGILYRELPKERKQKWNENSKLDKKKIEMKTDIF